MFNDVTLVGEVVSKPTIKETRKGNKVASIVLKIERPYKNSLGVRDTDLIKCVTWRGLANQIEDYCDIGSIVGVKGRIQSTQVEEDSSPELEVKIEHIEYLDRFFKV